MGRSDDAHRQTIWKWKIINRLNGTAHCISSAWLQSKYFSGDMVMHFTFSHERAPVKASCVLTSYYKCLMNAIPLFTLHRKLLYSQSYPMWEDSLLTYLNLGRDQNIRNFKTAFSHKEKGRNILHRTNNKEMSDFLASAEKIVSTCIICTFL